MVEKRSIGEVIFDNANVIFLILLSLVAIYPFLYVVFASFSEAEKLVSHSGLLLKPLGFNISSYAAVFKNPQIYSGYFNTIVYVVIGTTINVILTSFGAFVLSRKNLYWKNAIMFMIIFTMFFGGGLIPTFLWMRSLGLMNNRLIMLLPGAISTSNLIIMRTYFKTIPDSLEESAKIDGANDITVLFKIILPLAKPVIAVMILYYGVAHWNSWFNAMVYLKDRSKWPLQLILREILVQNANDDMMNGIDDASKYAISETIKYATTIVATVPILMIYPFLQKYFVKGVMIGAIKE